MGYNPQESLQNTINTMGTLLGVHPIVSWHLGGAELFLQPNLLGIVATTFRIPTAIMLLTNSNTYRRSACRYLVAHV